MKKTITGIKCMLLLALIINFTYTQAQSQPQSQSQQQDPKMLNDRTMSDKLQKDLNNRNAMTANQQISWFDAGHGYYGTYALDSVQYMTRYDRQGNYVETLRKRDWDDNVSASVTDAFNQSQYKNQQVSGYWEVTDPNRKGYYFELSDRGRTQRVWLNDKNTFSTSPYTVPPSTSSKPIN